MKDIIKLPRVIIKKKKKRGLVNMKRLAKAKPFERKLYEEAMQLPTYQR